MIQNLLIKKIAKTLNVDSDKVDKILNMSSKYDNTKEGLMKCITENGGLSQINEMKKYKNNSTVKKALSMMGADINQVERLLNELPTDNNKVSALNRLKNLK